MPLIQPFAALRPAAGRADDVVAPPYDVMNAEEARAMADGRPWSFLHISRPEIDLPEGTDPYAAEVYAKARENLDHMVAEGVKSAPAVIALAKEFDVDMPIAEEVFQVVQDKGSARSAFRGLLRTVAGAESEPG